MRVLLKREDLTHTGSHKINNVLGQCLLTRRMGKKRVIAETGAGQHGVATATGAALFGLGCTVYMGAVDVERQALNVWRMKLLGAEVVPVESGSATLKDAVNEAMRGWVRVGRDDALLHRLRDGSAPVPVDGARVPARRRRRSARASAASCSTATIPTSSSRASAAARTRSARSPRSSTPTRGSSASRPAGSGSRAGHHGAAVSRGVPGVVHGMRSLFLQDEYGQVLEATSISAGLDYPGVGPEHAMLAAQRPGRVPLRDRRGGARRASSCSPRPRASCPRSSPRTRSAGSRARPGTRSRRARPCCVTLSGRGDKDAAQVAERLGEMA